MYSDYVRVIHRNNGGKGLIIGLLDFEFASPNKGCEALAYSFAEIIKSVVCVSEIICFTNNGIGDFANMYPNFQISICPIILRDRHAQFLRKLAKCDYVFDITNGDSFSDIYSEKFCMSNLRYKFFAELIAKRYILLPQTYGPFRNKIIKRRAKNIINRAYRVYTRDEKSLLYLRNMCGIKREIFLTTDLAFSLPIKDVITEKIKDKFSLGINVSGLLWNGGFNSKNQFELTIDYQRYIRGLLERYTAMENVQVFLIPHVLDRSKNAHDDDTRTIEKLHRDYPNTIIAPYFLNPIDAKSYISNMDCFVGARMHSTIAAFSTGVPTIPVSYSRKFEGLYNDLHYPYLIHATNMTTDEALERTIEYISDADELRECVNEASKIWKTKTELFIKNLKMGLSVNKS